MIDTLVLLLDYPNFDVYQPEKFYPNARTVLNLNRQAGYCTQRQSKVEVRLEGYKPQLRLCKRPMDGAGVHIYLVVQFSAPKLLFGNNFDEVEDDDFDRVIDKLQTILYGMGVKINKKSIEEAHVSTIHYGKNFVLTDYTTPYTYIEEIRRANINRIYDVNRTDFRNEGHSYKFRSNTFELTLYDKVKDLERAKISTRRSVEEDSGIQTGLAPKIKRKRQQYPFEVLRLEIRLNGTRKLKAEFRRLGIVVEPSFRNLFSKAIAKTICLDYLEQVKSKLALTVGRYKKSFTDNLADLISSNPGKNPSFLFSFAAFQEVVKESDVRTARQLIDPKNSGKWYRLKKEFETVIHPSTPLKIDSLIEKAKIFKTERLADY